MNRKLLIAYQLVTGASDTITGALLMIAPSMTLGWMGVSTLPENLVFLSYVGSFVFGVGLCCLYGLRLVVRGDRKGQLNTVWLLTALLRASVATFVTQQVIAGNLAANWLMVAVFDSFCVLIQAIGLRRKWGAYAAQ